MTEQVPGATPTANPSVQHERTDLDAVWIFGLAAGFLVLAIVIYAALWWLFNHYAQYHASIKQSAFPLAEEKAALPPTPRLEEIDRMAGFERSNVYVREAAKEAVRDAYGATEEKGYVRIPVQRAMKLLENRLPARTQPGQDQRRQQGLIDGGGPNSGRMMREKEP